MNGTSVMNAAALHGAIQAGVNSADVDSLVALYEPDAMLLGEDGTVSVGTDAIREVWAAVVAYGGRMTLRTRSAVELGDIAQLSNHWTYEIGCAVVAGAITSEVARRQPDGTWRYVIDNPYVAAAPSSVTACAPILISGTTTRRRSS